MLTIAHMSTEALRVRVEIFVANHVELARIDAMRGPAAAGWPCVDCSDWLDGMDSLAADMSDQDMSVFGDHELVFPEGDASEWDGPWLVRVPDDVITVLAEVSDDELAAFEAGRSEREAERDAELRELCRQAIAERRDVASPGAARSRSLGVMVPSIRSPVTTTNRMPRSARSAWRSRIARSPACFDSATGS